MIKFGVILNPTSGKGKGAIFGPKFVEELQKLGVEVLELTGANYQEATENGRKAVAAGSIDALAVAGGDGMVHLGLNLCAGTSMPPGHNALWHWKRCSHDFRYSNRRACGRGLFGS